MVTGISKDGMTLGGILDYLEYETPKELKDKTSQICRVACSSVVAKEGNLCFLRSIEKKGAEERIKSFAEKKPVAIVVNRNLVDLARSVTNVPIISTRKPGYDCAKVVGCYRSFTDTVAIAVTGSIGKTSAKEMIRLVSNKKFKTKFSRGNANGVARTVDHVQNFSDDVEAYVQEVGLSTPNSVKYAAMALRPNYFFVTNIGLNHVGYFGGVQENILKEKLNVDVYAADGAVGFINFDDPLLSKAEYKHKVLSYGVENKDVDYLAENIVEVNGGVSFEVVETATGERVAVRLNLPGFHNVYNALAAYAFGKEIGVEPAEIVDALAEFHATGVRQNLVWLDGQHVYLDCYNASEGAIQSVITTSGKIEVPEGGKRIIVLADIDDKLGSRTEEVHRRVGKSLINYPKIGLYIFFGDHMRWAYEEAQKEGITCLFADDYENLKALIKENLGKDDLISFKGGQQMRLSLLVDDLFGTTFYLLDGDVLRKDLEETFEFDGYVFKKFRDYGVVLAKFDKVKALSNSFIAKVIRKLTKAKQKPFALTVPSKVSGNVVRCIGKGAFSKEKVDELTLPEGLVGIGENAFRMCRRLKVVNLPHSLRYIGIRAFSRCSELTTLTLPEGLETIDMYAFYRCSKLTEITIPNSVKTISPKAFVQSSKVTIKCEKGSYAEEFAKENGLPVIYSNVK